MYLLLALNVFIRHSVFITNTVYLLQTSNLFITECLSTASTPLCQGKRICVFTASTSVSPPSLMLPYMHMMAICCNTEMIASALVLMEVDTFNDDLLVQLT